MYQRYDIPTHETPAVRPLPNKFHPTVRRLGLARMLLREAVRYRLRRDVMLSRPCIYGVFGGPLGGFLPRREACVGCMRCVQEYPDMCRVDINPAWQALGDAYVLPDAVSTLDAEATSGKVPIKGVGYKGPFAGPGFDALWTDMSEIVRPTRDGIYGREHISTMVDVGRRPPVIDPRRPAPADDAPIIDLPLPFVFDVVPERLSASGVEAALLAAARRLGTLAIIPWDRLRAGVAATDSEAALPLVPHAGLERALAALAGRTSRAIEVADAAPADLARLRQAYPRAVPIARLALGPDAPARAAALAAAGAGALHLVADYHGRCAAGGAFVMEAVRAVHDRLVDDGVRETLTLIAAGGIARAEHVPKILIGGADLAALDVAAWVAVGASFRGDFVRADQDTLDLPRVDKAWGAQRLVNLGAAWRNQLLEILSAMGLREVRRLRGETGRAIFWSELEAEAFGDLERVP